MKSIRSILCAGPLAAVAILGVACGTASSEKESGKEEGKDGSQVVVSGDSVQFEIAPPSETESSGAALTDQAIPEPQPAPVEPTPQPDDAEPTPEPKPSNRIQIRCKGDVKADMLIAEEDLPKRALSRFQIGLETIQGDNASYESVSFNYSCGSAGAVVTIGSLTAGAKYAVDALYWTNDVLSHKGKTEYFALGRDGTASVRLLMNKVMPVKKGKAKVDVIFKDVSEDPAMCPALDYACADIFAPVVCTGIAAPLDGREIAFEIGPIEAGNYCEAKRELSLQACERKAKLIDIKCK